MRPDSMNDASARWEEVEAERFQSPERLREGVCVIAHELRRKNGYYRNHSRMGYRSGRPNTMVRRWLDDDES